MAFRVSWPSLIHSMARPNRFLNSRLTNAQQLGRMAARHPQLRGSLRRGAVRWIGTLLPSALSEAYIIQIDYDPPRRPKISILRPKLMSRTLREQIPHTFRNGTVCLHLPDEWTSARSIADTIVHWLSLWLLHYEIWLALGKWMGGGH